MKARSWRASAALVSFALASGCSPGPDFEVAEDEFHLRYVEGKDTLEFLEIRRGLFADKPRKAVDALEKLIAGWRRFPAQGGWLAQDLDDLDSWLEEEGSADVREVRARVIALMPWFQVERAGLFLDERKRLSFYRLTRVQHVAMILDVVNDFTNLLLREESGSREFRSDFPIFDQETFDLFARAGEADHAWLRMEDGKIALEYPMTEGNAARCLSEILRGGDPMTVPLFAHVRSIRVADGTVRLTFGAAEDGWFHYSDVPNDGQEGSTILAELEARGHSLEAAPTLTEIRAIMGEG